MSISFENLSTLNIDCGCLLLLLNKVVKRNSRKYDLLAI